MFVVTPFSQPYIPLPGEFIDLLHLQMHTYVHVCTRTYTSSRAHVCLYACMLVIMFGGMHARACVETHMCAHVRTCGNLLPLSRISRERHIQLVSWKTTIKNSKRRVVVTLMLYNVTSLSLNVTAVYLRPDTSRVTDH